MTNDIKVLNGLTAISPTITIWSGKRKMLATDYGVNTDELPPSEIMDLGTKKLCPPEKMRVFLTLKARCIALLDRHGIRFIASSWLVPKEMVKDITADLEGLKQEFLTEKTAFLASYDATVQDWIARHPQWAEMLARAVPSADYVSSKLSFDWKTFRFSMARDSNIADDVTHLADSVFTNIARQAAEAYRNIFADKEQSTRRALGPLKAMESKLAGLAFLEPRVGHAAGLIHTALEELPSKGVIQGQELSKLLGLVCLLKSPEALEELTGRMAEGQNVKTLLGRLHAPEPVTMPISGASARIESQGLW